jgi:hypothetical protein
MMSLVLTITALGLLLFVFAVRHFVAQKRLLESIIANPKAENFHLVPMDYEVFVHDHGNVLYSYYWLAGEKALYGTDLWRIHDACKRAVTWKEDNHEG